MEGTEQGTERGEDKPTEKCPEKVYIRAASRGIRGDRASARQLRQDGIELHSATIWSLYVAGRVGTRHIGVAFLVILLISLAFGGATGCHAGTWLQAGCQNTVFRETKTTVGDLSAKKADWPASANREAAPPDQGLAAVTKSEASSAGGAIRNASGESLTVNLGSETSNITRQQLAGARFNLPAFQACMLFCAFALAFSRWMIENRHAAMSELFERKKEVNLLLLNDKEGVFKPLVSEALEPFPKAGGELVEALELNAEKCREYLMRALVSSAVPGNGIDGDAKPEGAGGDQNGNTEFLRQMFVYIELDNFELALNRYLAGLLAPEQMNRAREIIESRCANSTFRQMAAVQGLKYYTESFHWALKHILIRTQYVASLRKLAEAGGRAEAGAIVPGSAGSA